MILENILKQFFGYGHFRPLQREAIQATLDKQDTLLILPTGGGKSLTYSMPPLVRGDCFSIVISPLLALIQDQVDSSLNNGINAVKWDSQTSQSQREKILSTISNPEPDIQLLFTTPESVQEGKLLEALKAANDLGTICSIAIDEAHCVSQWGHDFRASYLLLKKLRKCLLGVPMAACTATATCDIKQDIIEALGLQEPKILNASFNRPNICYEIKYRELIKDGGDDAVLQDLVHFIRTQKGQGLIYCRTRKECDWVNNQLQNSDIDCASYHAGQDDTRRKRVQNDWLDGTTDIVVATIAFGLGINKADVGWIVHWGMSTSVEGYYQESGRGGRNGDRCIARVYTGPKDVKKMLTQFKRLKYNPKGQTLQDYALGSRCRRSLILSFFSESRKKCEEGDAPCDFCQNPTIVAENLRKAMEIDQTACEAQQWTAQSELDKRNQRGLQQWSNPLHSLDPCAKKRCSGGGIKPNIKRNSGQQQTQGLVQNSIVDEKENLDENKAVSPVAAKLSIQDTEEQTFLQGQQIVKKAVYGIGVTKRVPDKYKTLIAKSRRFQCPFKS